MQLHFLQLDRVPNFVQIIIKKILHLSPYDSWDGVQHPMTLNSVNGVGGGGWMDEFLDLRDWKYPVFAMFS